jgi:non-ribosomal peptide synthase protein (TIGR01720 family)
MVPALFVELDAFPMTANKKVDRTRLPEPEGHRPELDRRLVAPRTATEATLARIWCEFLELEQVGIHDDFFDLGGDSLLALRSIMRANREGVPLAPNAILRAQTIAELAAMADEGPAMPGLDDQPVGPAPLTPAQLRFLTERASPEPQHWNVSTLIETESLDPDALHVAVAEVLEHHDALRMRLWRDDDGWHQAVLPTAQRIPIETHDLRDLPPAERVVAIDRICGRLQESFDLGEGLMLRVAHFACGPNASDRLFVVVHHFAVDMLTFGVLWEDLEHAYRQAAHKSTIALPAKTTSFRSWALQLERLARQPRVQKTLPVWTSLPWHDVAALPTDHSAGLLSNTNASAAAIAVELGADTTERLLSGRRRPEHVILAALGQALGRWTASPTVLIDVLSHGRDAALDGVNLSRTVGFMLSFNPLVLTHPTWVTSELLDPLVRQIEATPEGFTFELLRFLGPDHDVRARLTGLPRADVLFNYAGVVARVEEDAHWHEVHEPSGLKQSPRGLRQYPLAVRATLAPDLRLTFVYSTALHDARTIEARANEVAATVRALVA